MLQFENLCAGYAGRECLHNLSTPVSSGLLTAVIGPNGCGKSTLMKCAAGILKPLSGLVLLNQQNAHALASRERARLLSYMPQSRVIPDITVRQLAAHGRYPHLHWGERLQNTDFKIIGDALERTGLTALADRAVSELSGGERQKAYLAMMLTQQSPVMLLDEPTTYLDLSAQFALMNLLKSLCREGRSTLVVLHDLSLALQYADHILLMQRGCLVASGTPETIMTTGMIESVFNIHVSRTAGGQYVFSPAHKEEQS